MGMALFYVTVLVFFFWDGFGVGRCGFAVFLKGGLGKVDFECGLFVVMLWWNAWFLWSRVCRFCGAIKHATFLKFIFAFDVEKNGERTTLGMPYQSTHKDFDSLCCSRRPLSL
jgi:hypothetical protein